LLPVIYVAGRVISRAGGRTEPAVGFCDLLFVGRTNYVVELLYKANKPVLTLDLGLIWRNLENWK